jgi:toxin YoeB
VKRLEFDSVAFKDYSDWKSIDKTVYEKITKLIHDIARTPFSGLGKPEPLKGNLRGYWSRRITHEHRLVYKASADVIFIASCKFHYEK